MSAHDKQLLDLRKKYKNTSLIYLNMQTQAIFLSACLHTPRGLRIRLRCMTPRRGAYNIEDVFMDDCERGFITIFRDHLSFVAAKLLVGLKEVATNLAITSERLSHQHGQKITWKRKPSGDAIWLSESFKALVEWLTGSTAERKTWKIWIHPLLPDCKKPYALI